MNYPLFNIKESALIPHEFKPLLRRMFRYLIIYQEVRFLLRKSGTLTSASGLCGPFHWDPGRIARPESSFWPLKYSFPSRIVRSRKVENLGIFREAYGPEACSNRIRRKANVSSCWLLFEHTCLGDKEGNFRGVGWQASLGSFWKRQYVNMRFSRGQ